MIERRQVEAARPGARSARLKLVLLALLFLLPIVSAYVLFFAGWRPAGTMHYGELVEPPRRLTPAALQSPDGRPSEFNPRQGKWLLVTFGTAACQGACADNLYKLRQIDLAQGKDATRVERVFVIVDQASEQRMRKTLAGYPGMQVYAGAAGAVGDVAAQFELPFGSPLHGLNRIYVVDPMGNLFMSYPADADPTGIRKDLARLLRISHVG